MIPFMLHITLSFPKFIITLFLCVDQLSPLFWSTIPLLLISIFHFASHQNNSFLYFLPPATTIIFTYFSFLYCIPSNNHHPFSPKPLFVIASTTVRHCESSHSSFLFSSPLTEPLNHHYVWQLNLCWTTTKSPPSPSLMTKNPLFNSFSLFSLLSILTQFSFNFCSSIILWNHPFF